MSNSTIVGIIEKYSVGPLTADETIILDNWLKDISPEEFHQTLDQCRILPAGLSERHVIPEQFALKLEARLNELEKPPIVKLSYRKKWMAIAASLIFLLAAGTLFWINHPAKNDVVRTSTNDVPPGSDGAILTLANGKQIILDSAHNGELATQGSATITKLDNGRLAYKALPTTTNEILYNTLTTPRGKKTNLVLSDGTAVWLNAASSIKYPTSFSGKDRTVEITGEAYFEVAKNAALPFIVKKMGSDYSIRVLGTSFNINAYEDEDAIKTTLLSGAVKVSTGDGSSMLNPGQQAVVQKSDEKIRLLADVNIGHVMAWKNGNFSFDRADIQTVMRQISRWYDVDVQYEGVIDQHFGGTISRDVNVSKVFQMLEMTGAVRFIITGRKIEVMP